MSKAVEVEYNHHDDVDILPRLKEMRETCPVAHSPHHGGFWIASTHAAISEVVHDPKSYSSKFVTVPRHEAIGDLAMPPLTMDPPEHGPIKRVLTTAFTVAKTAQLEPMVIDLVEQTLDAVADKRSFDAADDFARVLPTLTIARLLGLPAEDDVKFADWVHRIIVLAAEDESAIALMEVMEYLAGVVEERQQEPGTDLISYLISAEVEGAKLDDVEIILASVTLLLAGIDTTWRTLSAAIMHLAEHPEQQQTLRDNPDMMVAAVEEFLRFYAPVTVARETTGDVELQGCPVKSGEMVLIPFQSANRDPNAFPDPDELILDRSPNRHLAFGLGIHRCLGTNLARLELRTGLTAFLRRIGPFSLDPDGSVEWARGQITGPRTVPLLVSSE